jgi:hypothetical protein
MSTAQTTQPPEPKISRRRLLTYGAYTGALAAAGPVLPAFTAAAHAHPAPGARSHSLPFTFFLTHYELLGDVDNPSGVRYHSNGTPFAKARDGSSIAFTGRGAWDPASERVKGTGTYLIKDPQGEVAARGRWCATRFVSFLQLPGWWGIEDFKEEGWQGPPGSASFSGFLKLRVTLTGHGSGLLTLWCLMPTVPKPKGHVGDGLSFTGGGLRFTDFREQERGLEGVMFYSPGT